MNGFRYRVARVLGHLAVVIGILAVIAAAFALSYDAVRDIAVNAGVPVTLARIYPGILDAVFLVACAAALMLRDARWWTRLYTWLSVLVTGGLIGAADAYHSMGLRLPQRTTAGTIAALPWALVMLAFSLWLSMLRHTRTGSATPPDVTEPAASDEAESHTLAVAASPAARAALPAAERDPVTQPSIKNIEGRALETPPVAGATADQGAGEGRSPENPPAAPATMNEGSDEGRSPETVRVADVTTDEGAGEGRSPETMPAAVTAADEGPGAALSADHPGRSEGAVDEGPGDRLADDGESADDEVLGDREDEPASPAGPHPSDADTPPYGFPAVTGPAAQNGARTPTLLSAPVAADVATPAEAGAAQEAAAEPEDVAAKGKPPAASPELSGTEAELAHEDQPAANNKPATPFERVRSTPTRPAAD